MNLLKFILSNETTLVSNCNIFDLALRVSLLRIILQFCCRAELSWLLSIQMFFSYLAILVLFTYKTYKFTFLVLLNLVLIETDISESLDVLHTSKNKSNNILLHILLQN